MATHPSAWRLLHPRWVLLHVFVVAAAITMVWLGHWQWLVAHRHHGAIQNYAYAFQWWAFTGFTILMWMRVVRDYLRPGGGKAAEPVTVQAPKYIGYVVPDKAADDDSERVRFNAYLARLDASDREESR